MATETTPYGLPIIEPDVDYIRSPSSGDLSQDINKLATKTNAVIAQTAGETLAEANQKAAEIAEETLRWGVDLEVQPKRTSDTNRVYGWADKNGSIAMELSGDGELILQRDLRSPAISPLTRTQQFRHAFTDEAGHVSAGIDQMGRFQVFRGAGAPEAMRADLVAIGDSLTRGYSNGASWPLTESWPGLLQAQRPDVTVNNQGYSGRTTDEIRLLVGALALHLTPVGGTIPASGSVDVTTGQTIGWSTNNTIVIPGSLAGVGGTFTRTPTSLTFTRAGTGPAVIVPTSAKLIPRLEDFSSHTVVLWVGRNDVNQEITGMYDTVAEHVIAGVLETVEWLAPRSKSVVVVSATNRVDEVEGSFGHTTVQEINAGLRATLPHKYLEMRDYLVHQAIYDAGLTPTQADLDNMALDAPPPQIWDDGSHYLQNIAPFVSTRIQNRLTAKGLI